MKRFVPEFRTDERKAKMKNIISMRQPTLTIVLENVHDPHNVSAVIRSCDAVGILEANLIYYGRQIFPELAERSSASARKWVELKKHDSVKECYESLRSEGKKIFTTNMTADAISLYDLDLTQPIALVFGNEHSGVSEEATQQADGNFLIPQFGVIQSLNISVACAVTLFEACRQRIISGMYSQPQMPEELLKMKEKEWLSK